MMLTLAAWLHDIDPYAIQLWEGGPVRWYGLSYLVGFAIAWLLVRRVTRVGVSTLPPARAGDLIVTLAIGVVVGGRLGYVLFYRPVLFTTFYDTAPWWGVLAINEGGMASHGGMIGGALGCAWFAWRHRQPVLHLFDLLAFGAPLGLGLGRVANFINGELIGRPAPADLPWAVKFPQAIYDWPRDRLAELFAQLPPHIDRVDEVVAAVQRHDAQVIAVLGPMLTPRHPSQLYAALLEGLMVFLVLLWVWRVPRKPGLVGAWFAVSYGVARIVNEFFRMPDAHLLDAEFAAIGITRGQWLSALLLAVGVWGVWWSRRRDTAAMGAWRRGPWTRETEAEATPGERGGTPGA